MAVTENQYLSELATSCWTNAERMLVPKYDEPAARAAVQALVDSTRANRRHLRARRILEEFLQTGRRLVRQRDSPKAQLTARLQWTQWMMARNLFDRGVYNAAKVCTSACQRPATCLSVNHLERVECLESLSFPFRHDDGRWNVKKAADAIVMGLTLSGVARDARGHSCVPDASAVRMTILRIEDQQTGPSDRQKIDGSD